MRIRAYQKINGTKKFGAWSAVRKVKTDKAATSVFEDEGMEMEKNEKTKYKLAEAMKECMKTSKVDAITVKQLAEKCGLTRQTFYRNFLDKFDLINWYFGKSWISRLSIWEEKQVFTMHLCGNLPTLSRRNSFCCSVPL